MKKFTFHIQMIITACMLLAIFSCSNFNDYVKTPVTVRSAKNIGELISAEFHGEVYNSYHKYIYEQKLMDYKNIFDYVRFSFDTLSRGNDSLTYMNKPEKLTALQIIKNLNLDEMKSSLGIKKEENLLVIICKKDLTWEKFLEYPSKKNNKNLERYLKDESEAKNIAYIARGSVKAGYDLEHYNFDLYSEIKGDSLILHNLEPRILNYDINPWFAEEGRIKGFEIIELKKEKNITFEEMNKVKASCKQLLLAEAFDLDILEKAMESGNEHLQGLYTLLNINKQNPLNTIIIEAPALFEEKTLWLKDGLIDETEIEKIIEYNKLYSEGNDELLGFESSYKKQAYWEESLHQLNNFTMAEKNNFRWKEFYKTRFKI